jgi:hypothetical protein
MARTATSRRWRSGHSPGRAAEEVHLQRPFELLVAGPEEAVEPLPHRADVARTGDHGHLAAEGEVDQTKRCDEEVRFLAVSTNGAPDIVVYPDSDKIGTAERLPEGGGLHHFFDRDSQVDYWKDESAPDQ